ncbi:hypothetical protein RXV95_15075 [Novosphingobium sp. ZN18A2]|uniref:hypothetical protein n=1 Tax=Novosphingobium sp. ZN18A2 TaxID=3079861 RepID=UPI0030CFB5CA
MLERKTKDVRRFTDAPRLEPRTRLAILGVIALIHAGLVVAIIHGLGGVPAVLEKAGLDRSVRTYDVPLTPPPPPPPAPSTTAQEPEGKAAQAAPTARAKAVSAPKARIPIPKMSAAPVSSTGDERKSGAARSGEGTGGGGDGQGTGSGGQGNGAGGTIAVRPSIRSGELNEASDFPTPPGGRQTRSGGSVTVYFTVTVDGRACDCSVARSDVDAATTALVCPLVIRKIRFNPARRSDGTPVVARYGYRVDFRSR